MTKEQRLITGHVVLYSGLVAVSDVWPYADVIVASLVLGAILVWISIHDFRTYEIPNAANTLLGLSGLVFTGLRSFNMLGEHLLAAIFWAAMFWGVSVVFRRLKGVDGLGLGDAKMMFGVGAWLGFIPVISVVFVAAISGILFILVTRFRTGRKFRHSAIAFGPFLCLSMWYVWLFGPVGIIL